MACKLNMCVYAPLVIRAVSQLALHQQCKPCDVKYIESDSHLAIYTISVLGTMNAMVNLKQFSPIVLTSVETN